MAVGGRHVFRDRLGNFRRRRCRARGLVGWVAGRNSAAGTAAADQQRRDRCAHRARRQRRIRRQPRRPPPRRRSTMPRSMRSPRASPVSNRRQPRLRRPLPSPRPLPIRRLRRRSMRWKNRWQRCATNSRPRAFDRSNSPRRSTPSNRRRARRRRRRTSPRSTSVSPRSKPPPRRSRPRSRKRNAAPADDVPLAPRRGRVPARRVGAGGRALCRGAGGGQAVRRQRRRAETAR